LVGVIVAAATNILPKQSRFTHYKRWTLDGTLLAVPGSALE